MNEENFTRKNPNCHHRWKGHWSPLKIVGMVVAGIVGALVFALAFGYFVMLLWNWLMPSLFGISKIYFWQAFGIILLARLIFGTVGHHGPLHHRGHNRHHHHYRYHHWNRDCQWDEDDEWYLKGGWKGWRHYDEWWHNEGKTAFENYIENKKNNGEQEK
jgi:hypothetical protein